MFDSFVQNSLMKKFFISIMAIAAMLNFCSCRNEPIDTPDLERAIVFDNSQMRAIVNSADDILRMGVFAQMNLGDVDKSEAGSNSYIMLLDNELVSRYTKDDPWTYDNTRYWVANRVFHFFAVWPYSKDCDYVTDVKSVSGIGPYGYSVTFETPAAADQELLTAQATVKAETNDISDPVNLNFQHALTNVNLKIWRNGASESVQDKVKVKEVTISNVKKKGTLTTTIDGSSWDYSSEKMNFTKTYAEGTYAEGIEISQAQIIDGELVPNAISQNNPSNNSPCVPFGEDGLLFIPQPITSGDPIRVTVKYYLYDQEEKEWEEKILIAFLPEGTWPAGKRLTYNLILSGDKTYTEFEINTVVEDWYSQPENIEFSEQVVVDKDEKMNWVPGTYESINVEKGEVVLYTDVNKVAVCEFNISAPVGATWTASLIPLTASAMDAFSIVEDSKYGKVGTDVTQKVKVRINNPDPISARNACKLRITVQTSDGRTIVVKNLMPLEAANNGIEEFTIIQNLING